VKGLPTLRVRTYWNPPWLRLGYRKYSRPVDTRPIKGGRCLYLKLGRLDLALEVQRKTPRSSAVPDTMEVRGTLRRDEEGREYLEIDKGRYQLEDDGRWYVDFRGRVREGERVHLIIPRWAPWEMPPLERSPDGRSNDHLR
jgi:hypothetical protein